MRVLLVTGSYPPEHCGVGDYARELAVALAAINGIEVAVLTTGVHTTQTSEHQNVLIRFVPNWCYLSVLTLIRAIWDLRPHIVHVHYPTQGYGFALLPWLTPLLAWLIGAKVVQTWHEGFSRHDFLRFLLILLVPGRIVVVRHVWRKQFKFPFSQLAPLRKPIYIRSASTLPRSDLDMSDVRRLRSSYGDEIKRLIVFFGFIHPAKRVEILFDIADATTDKLLIVGSNKGQKEYIDFIESIVSDSEWASRVEIIGYADKHMAADIIKSADALVLPFAGGGGEWNTSILAGIKQGTFVLTTSANPSGYHLETNVYYADPNDIGEMKRALNIYIGRKRHSQNERGDSSDWDAIAGRHFEIYEALASRRFQERKSFGE